MNWVGLLGGGGRGEGEKGFWRPSPRGPVPKGITKFLACPIKDLILRFRTILAGLVNFYSFSDNISKLRYLYYLLRASLQRTICKKLNIGIREVIARYGREVTLTIFKRDGEKVQLDFQCPTLRRKPMNFQGTGYEKDPLMVKNWKVSTLTALDQCCANCGTFNKIEMHHLKHLKTMNAKSCCDKWWPASTGNKCLYVDPAIRKYTTFLGPTPVCRSAISNTSLSREHPSDPNPRLEPSWVNPLSFFTYIAIGKSHLIVSDIPQHDHQLR